MYGKHTQPHTAAQMRRLARSSDPDFGPNRKARRAAGVQAVPPWTQASRKPPLDTDVLAWGPERGAEVLRLSRDGVWRTAADDIAIDDPDYNPTHWMPLPKLPEET